MINPIEFRLGNSLLQKINNRIQQVSCDYQHFELMSKGELKEFFPVVLNPDILERCGFVENKDYPLLPEAREFKLVLPVAGNGANEIRAYIKNNKECFARAIVGNIPASNNLYHLHQLQNLHYALTGKEILYPL